MCIDRGPIWTTYAKGPTIRPRWVNILPGAVRSKTLIDLPRYSSHPMPGEVILHSFSRLTIIRVVAGTLLPPTRCHSFLSCRAFDCRIVDLLPAVLTAKSGMIPSCSIITTCPATKSYYTPHHPPRRRIST